MYHLGCQLPLCQMVPKSIPPSIYEYTLDLINHKIHLFQDKYFHTYSRLRLLLCHLKQHSFITKFYNIRSWLEYERESLKIRQYLNNRIKFYSFTHFTTRLYSFLWPSQNNLCHLNTSTRDNVSLLYRLR